jgi:hypothetical protein
MTKREFTQADLYGETGHPTPEDIRQHRLGDCFLISSMGSLAFHQPERIEHAIRFQPATSSFDVTLYKEEKGFLGTRGKVKPVHVEITQDDIQTDLDVGGSSLIGPNTGWKGPAWPAVMEAAYAKLSTQPGETVADGFVHIGHGGYPRDAMFALTGQHGPAIRAVDIGAGDLAEATNEIKHGLAEGRPMLLTTNPISKPVNDGLITSDGAAGHAYMVEGMSEDTSGQVHLTLRNPWGHNRAPDLGVDKKSPIVHAELKTIIENGHLQRIDIGPARIDETREAKEEIGRGHQRSASISTGDRYMDALLSDLDDPDRTSAALRNLASTPEAETFRDQGRMEFEFREKQAQFQAQMEAAVAAPVQSGPVLSL